MPGRASSVPASPGTVPQTTHVPDRRIVFNSDLALFKNFQIKESMKVQFRFNAYNFLNHPLESFQGGADTALSFNYQCSGGGPCTNGNGSYALTSPQPGHRRQQVV
jgi:hypothetical protein